MKKIFCQYISKKLLQLHCFIHYTYVGVSVTCKNYGCWQQQLMTDESTEPLLSYWGHGLACFICIFDQTSCSYGCKYVRMESCWMNGCMKGCNPCIDQTCLIRSTVLPAVDPPGIFTVYTMQRAGQLIASYIQGLMNPCVQILLWMCHKQAAPSNRRMVIVLCVCSFTNLLEDCICMFTE